MQKKSTNNHVKPKNNLNKQRINPFFNSRSLWFLRLVSIGIAIGLLIAIAIALSLVTVEPIATPIETPIATPIPTHTATTYLDLSDHTNPTTQFLLGIDGPDDYTKITPQPAPSDWGLPDSFTE